VLLIICHAKETHQGGVAWLRAAVVVNDQREFRACVLHLSSTGLQLISIDFRLGLQAISSTFKKKHGPQNGPLKLDLPVAQAHGSLDMQMILLENVAGTWRGRVRGGGGRVQISLRHLLLVFLPRNFWLVSALQNDKISVFGSSQQME